MVHSPLITCARGPLYPPLLQGECICTSLCSHKSHLDANFRWTVPAHLWLRRLNMIHLFLIFLTCPNLSLCSFLGDLLKKVVNFQVETLGGPCHVTIIGDNQYSSLPPEIIHLVKLGPVKLGQNVLNPARSDKVISANKWSSHCETLLLSVNEEIVKVPLRNSNFHIFCAQNISDLCRLFENEEFRQLKHKAAYSLNGVFNLFTASSLRNSHVRFSTWKWDP